MVRRLQKLQAKLVKVTSRIERLRMLRDPSSVHDGKNGTGTIAVTSMTNTKSTVSKVGTTRRNYEKNNYSGKKKRDNTMHHNRLMTADGRGVLNNMQAED